MSPLENSILVFRTSEKISGLYDTLFGGIYRMDWLVRYEKIAALLSFAAAVSFLYIQFRSRKDCWGLLSRCFAVAGFSLMVLLLNEPVDELFINLRHSLHFAQSGLFSFNQNTPIEGIVDFLPYFTIGCLARLGLPLPEMAFLQGFLGALLCLLALWRISSVLGLTATQRTLGFFILCASPTLMFNASIGFSSPIFSAAILWSIAFLFFQPYRTFWGLFLLSVIPLIRLEGALATAILFLFYVYQHQGTWAQKIRQSIGTALLIVIPIILLSCYRIRTFGSAIPTPVIYKSAFGNPVFLKLGTANLAKDLFSGYGALATITVLWCLFLSRPQHITRQIQTLLTICAGLGVFILPYYLSGGDWFPPAWGRYLLPYTLLSTFAAICMVFLVSNAISHEKRRILYGGILLLLVPYLFLSSGYPFLAENLRSWWPGRGNFRIQQLSMVGRHLGNTTRPTDVIASSEVATVMYFANREALDLLGVTNPAIAAHPINSASLFRRHYPELVLKVMPQILYPGDFLSTDLSEETTGPEIVADIKRLRLTYASMNERFFGGPQKLLCAGYRPIVVIFGNHFGAMYYVSAEAWPSHLASLLRAGFRQDSVEAPLLSRK